MTPQDDPHKQILKRHGLIQRQGHRLPAQPRPHDQRLGPQLFHLYILALRIDCRRPRECDGDRNVAGIIVGGDSHAHDGGGVVGEGVAEFRLTFA